MQIAQTSDSVFEFIGTAKDFATAGIKLNGKMVDQVTVGALARHGLIEEAGFGQKPARGRTPTMYKAVSRPGMIFSGSQLFVRTEENTENSGQEIVDDQASA